MNRISAVVLSMALLGPAGLGAQAVPFGKNKIQYTRFDWQVISGPHLDVYYYPEEEELARVALAYGEESFRVLEERFEHHPFRRVPLVVYSSHQHFEQTNLTPGFIPEGVAGFTEFLKRRIALPFRGSYTEFRHTLRHEIVHFFQLSKLSETFALHGRIRRAGLPHWWSEGLAEYWSSPQDSEDEMVIRDVVLEGNLPGLRTFSYMASFLSYPLGGELFHYLTDRFGEEHIVEMYEDLWKYDSFEDAFAGVYGVSLEGLDREWRYHLEQKYFPLYAERAPLDVDATPLVTRDGPNFKPAAVRLGGDSVPQLFFLSPRTGYTNVYRTDLERRDGGVRVVVEGERSAEFESFHAYESRIDLSPEGVLAFVSKFNERDALFLWSVEREDVVGRYQWQDLVGLQSPSWSPDMRRIVFSGLSVSGYQNLYVLDFESGERRSLTQDRYHDEDPDWSPDGRHIVFSSDRTPHGAQGAHNLFVYDVETGGVRFLTHGPWKDRDPRWSNDGARVAFTSDRTGFFELYTVDLDGTGERVSNFTGSAMDPEWLPDDSGLVFTGFARGTFLLYEQALPASRAEAPALIALELPDAGRERPAPEEAVASANGNGTVAPATSPGAPDTARAVLPEAVAQEGTPAPIAAGASAASVSAADASAGGPSARNGLAPGPEPWTWEELQSEAVEGRAEDYSHWRSFGLDFAGGDALIAPGLGSAQGVQLMGSDMLGNHILFLGITAVQTESFRNLADAFSGQLLYLNLSRRLNVGGGVFRYKGLFRDVSYNVYEEESYGGLFVASYPFSKFTRLEFQTALEWSDRVDREDFYRPDVREDPRDLTREALLSRNFLSYVKDNTLWLPFGPIDGVRYNLTLGLLSDFSRGRAESFVAMADYRRYLRTSLRSAIALRASGYYSGGAIPGRAALGGAHRLRGYPRLSLAGSRVWLVNTEWRFPLLNSLTFSLPIGNLTFPGIQGAAFADLGSSWLEGQEPEGSWGSYGMAFRWSLGYPFVLRLDVGRRFRIGDEPPLFFGPGKDFNDGFVDFFFGFNY